MVEKSYSHLAGEDVATEDHVHHFAEGRATTTVEHETAKLPSITYLSIAAELGVIGLAAFAWLFGLVIRDAVLLGRGPAAAVSKPLLAIILAVLGQSLVSNGEHYRSLWIAVGMLAGVYEAAGRGEGG